jgi:hypothetical protein
MVFYACFTHAVFIGIGLLAMHNSIIKVKNNNKTYTVTIEETPQINTPIVPQKIILIV